MLSKQKAMLKCTKVQKVQNWAKCSRSSSKVEGKQVKGEKMKIEEYTLGKRASIGVSRGKNCCAHAPP